MKKIILLFSLILFILSGCSAQPASDPNKIQVIASFFPLADFANKIGGDRVSVKNLVKTGEEIHDYEMTPADKEAVIKSKLFIYNGLNLESWAKDLIATIPSGVTVLNASDQVTTILSQDKNEPGIDPHIWLSPVNAIQMMKNIAAALIAVDPDSQSVYEANLADQLTKMQALNQRYIDQLQNRVSNDLVTTHEAFGYLAHAYGLNQVPIEGIYGESEPDPQTLKQIISFVNEHHTKVIFMEELASPKVAQTIANETGATLMTLHTLEGLTKQQADNQDDYYTLMQANLEALVTALN